MTEPRLTLHGVSFALPGGSALFTGLSDSFGATRTALVGRNGAGKSVLARILAGELAPSAGRCERLGTLHFVTQQAALPRPGQTVAGLAGLEGPLQALRNIENGSCAAEDFELLAERWDLRERLQAALQQHGLPPLPPETPASQLSCGQAMRVALIGAQLADADFLLLDEPGNHLDQAGRQALAQFIARWPRGLLLISHDRALLRCMERIVELAPHGLHSYGGNYDFYLQARRQSLQAAQARLAQRKLERTRQEHAMRVQQERQQRKSARGDKAGQQANQARILLDRQKQRAQDSAGKLAQQHATAWQALDRHVRQAWQQMDAPPSIHLHLPSQAVQTPRIVAELREVRLPHLQATEPAPIDWRLQAGHRIAVTGPNGCGKSTLLQVLAGTLPPLQGQCLRHAPHAFLDQRLQLLRPECTVLELLQAASPATAEAEQRMRLAQLGLSAPQLATPSARLSGGERLKAALACALYADEPAALLLLDEPDNHLDLASIEALEQMLSQYRGTLVLVSHDEELLQRLQLTHRLEATDKGWQLREA